MKFSSSIIIIIIFIDLLSCGCISNPSTSLSSSSSSFIKTLSPQPSLSSPNFIFISPEKAKMNLNLDEYFMSSYHEKKFKKFKNKIKYNRKKNLFKRKKRKTEKLFEKDQIATTNTLNKTIELRTTKNTIKTKTTATIMINTHNHIIENNYFYYYDSDENQIEINKKNNENIKNSKNRIKNPAMTVRGTYSPIGTAANVGTAQLRQIHICQHDLGDLNNQMSWVALFKLESSPHAIRHCSNVITKAKLALRHGALAVIFDVTESKKASSILSKQHHINFMRPVLVVEGFEASKIQSVLQEQSVSLNITKDLRENIVLTRENTATNNNIIIIATIFVVTIVSPFVVATAFLTIKICARRRNNQKATSTKKILNGIKVLPYEEVEEIVNQECIICFDKYLPLDVLRELPCGHIFHSKCVDKWLTSHVTCPLCVCHVVQDHKSSTKQAIQQKAQKIFRSINNNINNNTNATTSSVQNSNPTSSTSSSFERETSNKRQKIVKTNNTADFNLKTTLNSVQTSPGSCLQPSNFKSFHHLQTKKDSLTQSTAAVDIKYLLNKSKNKSAPGSPSILPQASFNETSSSSSLSLSKLSSLSSS